MSTSDFSGDPFADLASPLERQRPRPSFARDLRRRVRSELGLDDEPPPTISLPERKPTMSTTDIPGSGDDHRVTTADRPGTGGGIWAAVHSHTPLDLIDRLVDVFGFERQIVVVADDGVTVQHSQLRWPEGGVVQVGSHDPANPFSGDPGSQSLYVVTADPHGVWERSQAAGFEVVREPEEPDYAPGTMVFAVRDPEGNVWSFGQYGLGL